MTDEKVIDAEFDKDDCGPFDSPISAYKAGFRTAERLVKIEVLNGLGRFINMITDQDIAGEQEESYYLACKHFKHEIENQIAQLKAGN